MAGISGNASAAAPGADRRQPPSAQVTAGDWLVPLVPDLDRPVTLVTLPHVGGGPATFGDCARRLSPEIATWGLNLPGRQARFAEPPVTDLVTVVDAVVAALEQRARVPYVLFGYCSGAISAYLAAHAVRDRRLPAPAALVVASFPAPHRFRVTSGLPALPADEFWAEISSYGGIDPVLAAQPDYREIFEPALRADYALLADFRLPEQPVLDIPVFAFAGRHDRLTSGAELFDWAGYTTSGFRLDLLDTGHWVLDGVPGQVERILEDVCLRYAGCRS